MPPRNLGNRNPGSERLGDDPPLLLHRPAPAASYPGANVHPPARELRVAYSVAHMCETFPPNQQGRLQHPAREHQGVMGEPLTLGLATLDLRHALTTLATLDLRHALATLATLPTLDLKTCELLIS